MRCPAGTECSIKPNSCRCRESFPQQCTCDTECIAVGGSVSPITPCPPPVHCTAQIGCIIRYELDESGCSFCYADCGGDTPVVPQPPGPHGLPCEPCNTQCGLEQFLHQETDMMGCPVCSCRDCPKLLCLPVSPGGGCKNGIHILDDNKCKTCQCAVDCEPCMCPYGQMPFATSYNISGCPGCTCMPCPVPACAQPSGNEEGCLHGYKYTEYGCLTCECVYPPSPTPLPLPRCPQDRFVTSQVPQGAYNASTGCPVGTAKRTVERKDICCYVTAVNSDKPGKI